METVQKIKNREVKREMMSQILDCKVKVAKVIEVLRTCQTQQITNIQIAQLNDCAYKAIRKVGVQKKLDERALKNEAIFKNLEKKLTQITEGMNFDKIKANWQEIIHELGNCPLSCSDTLELMQNGDCMCLSLQISRTEATIQDPTKLVIKGIVPTYMSMDSFLDASIFKLK